jgi:hypothetical protein
LTHTLPIESSPRIHSSLHSNPRNASVSYTNRSQVSNTTQQEQTLATMNQQGLGFVPVFPPGYELAFAPRPVLQFDLARGVILCWPTPAPKIAMPHLLTRSSTVSPYRVHWNELLPWNDFGETVSRYWNNIVPQHDKAQNVIVMATFISKVQEVSFPSTAASRESRVRKCLEDFIRPVLESAANGAQGAPRPSDRHSLLTSWDSEGVEGNRLAGVPDYVMINEQVVPPARLRRITVIFEVKTPWMVTPTLIDDVIEGMYNISKLLLMCRSCPQRRTPRSPCRGTTIRIYGPKCQDIRCFNYHERMVFSATR